MKPVFLILTITALIQISCKSGNNSSGILPVVPKGAEAISAGGDPLYSREPTPSVSERYKSATAEWKSDRSDPDKIIWYGRWAAYAGEYRESKRIFSQGIKAHRDDARFLRHRGHRYITIREFDRAITDLERAALITSFIADQSEPDGMPNAMNIPVSTLKSNIYYHLGLAWYLEGDTEKALVAWRNDFALNINDDMKVATLHWIYTALSDLGRKEEAAEALSEITDTMNIIENQAYHKLCLFYKGDIGLEQLESGEYSSIMNDAMLFGLGNWFLNNNDPGRAAEYFGTILNGGAWASFGYIAAEVKTSRRG